MKLNHGETPAALQEADQGLRRFPQKDKEWHWRFRVLKAEVFHAQGRERESLALLEEELPAALATSELAVRRKTTQGAARTAMGVLKEADQDLAEAEALANKYHPEMMGEVALRCGTFQFVKGDTAAAEADYTKARGLAQEQKDSFLEAAALSGVGMTATMQGHYDQAIDRNRDATNLMQSIGGAGSLANTLGNIGWNYAELGDYQSALRFYKEAEEEAVKRSLFVAQTRWLTSIAYAEQGLHDYTGAETTLKQVLQLARAQDNKENLAQCLSQLAWIALWTGRNDLAEGYNREAAELEKQVSPRLAVDLMLLHGVVAARRRNYPDAGEIFLAVIQKPEASKFQQWKAQAELARVYAEQGRDADAEREFLSSLKTSEGVRGSVQSEGSRLFFLSNTIIFYSDFVDFLMARHREEDALQAAELSRARTLAEGLGAVSKTLSFPLPNFHPKKIAERRKAVLLVYWLGPQQSYLWSITPTKISSYTLAKQSEIEQLASGYREAMQGGKDLLDGRRTEGQKLYEMLVAPAEKEIPKNARVIVLADAKLHRLNFETLVVPGPAPHFWIEDVTVSTASSLTLLASGTAAPAKSEKQLLLVGNTDSPNQDFPSLAQAPQEIKDVEQYFPEREREVLEGKQATPRGYLGSRPERFKYVHFVTHGTSSSNHPLESAVILSPEGDAYKLYAREIVQHHLNANLVTISACNGAGTQSYSGEGLVGLSWAFVRAGAHNVISALWEVSDVSTPQLMDALYAGLSKGKDPATALRDAKLSLLHSSDAGSVYRKPYYWAPFQLYAGS